MYHEKLLNDKFVIHSYNHTVGNILVHLSTLH